MEKLNAAKDHLPAMQDNLAHKQLVLRRLEEEVFDLDDALSAADTVLTKVQGTSNKALTHLTAALLEILGDEKEAQLARVSAQMQDCKEQYERIAAMQKLAGV